MTLLHKASIHAVGLAISATAGLMAIVINESSGFSLGVIFTVFCGVWWLSAKLQKVQDRIQELNGRINRLPCQGVQHACEDEKETE